MKEKTVLRLILSAVIAGVLVACAQWPPTRAPQVKALPAAHPAQAPQPLKPIPRVPQIAAPAGLSGKPPADQMVVHFIDVGQGDAELLEFSCGAVLIDTGGETTDQVNGRDNLVAFLKAFFKRRADLGNTLDLVLLSHPHIDHTDGVGTADPPEGLLGLTQTQNLTILNVVDNGKPPQDASGAKGQRALQESIASHRYFAVSADEITTTAGVTNSIIDPIDCRSKGGLDPQIIALWGRVDPSAGSWTDNPNNNSVVVKVQFGAASFLFMGDLQEQAINAMLDSYSPDPSIFDSDVLKVGHHGSNNATTLELVQAVTPKIAAIGAGDSTLSHATYSAYSFGHPNKVAVDLLLDPTDGVTLTRPSRQVTVGIKGINRKKHLPPQFQSMTLNRAIYVTAWDGTIAITAHSDGTLTVATNQ